MKAIVLEPGTLSGHLKIKEIADPVLQEDEVLIQVKAISINPVDVKTSKQQGVYRRIKDEENIIPGWDISGVVTESNSILYKEGDEVFGMINFPGHGQAYAEYVAAPASQLALKPANIPHEEAAAATLAALTAYQSIVKLAGVKAGQKVLIHAAAGGVGHFAVQIAKHFGAHVTGTSSARNRDFVLQLGADEHIDYHTYAWDRPAGFDLILDTIGGDNIDRSLQVAKTGSILISIPSGLNESVAEKAKAKGISGYTFMVQSDGDDMNVIAGYLKDGIIKAHVSATFPFEDMDKAHEQVASGSTVGKVVVTV